MYHNYDLFEESQLICIYIYTYMAYFVNIYHNFITTFDQSICRSFLPHFSVTLKPRLQAARWRATCSAASRRIAPSMRRSCRPGDWSDWSPRWVDDGCDYGRTITHRGLWKPAFEMLWKKSCILGSITHYISWDSNGINHLWMVEHL